MAVLGNHYKNGETGQQPLQYILQFYEVGAVGQQMQQFMDTEQLDQLTLVLFHAQAILVNKRLNQILFQDL